MCHVTCQTFDVTLYRQLMTNLPFTLSLGRPLPRECVTLHCNICAGTVWLSVDVVTPHWQMADGDEEGGEVGDRKREEGKGDGEKRQRQNWRRRNSRIGKRRKRRRFFLNQNEDKKQIQKRSS